MLRKFFYLMMTAMMMLVGVVPASASPFVIEQVPPDKPIETDGEFAHVVCTYDAEKHLSRYTLTLKDGAAVTAEDLLFTYYLILDPGYSEETGMEKLDIPGLDSYRMQYSEERLAEARAMLEGIRAAGKDHEWAESDGWTLEAQETYWSLQEEYLTRGADGFPALAKAIVDYCAASLNNSDGAMDMSAEEIAASEGLTVAYAMVTWGHAAYADGRVTTGHSRTFWNVAAGTLPSLEEYAAELHDIYGGDLGRAWKVENPGSEASAPKLPDVETAFIDAVLGGVHDDIDSIRAIRLVDERTLEFDLNGIDMRSEGELFGMPVYALAEYGDAELWNPEKGEYGHAFGEVAEIVDALGEGAIVVARSAPIF